MNLLQGFRLMKARRAFWRSAALGGSLAGVLLVSACAPMGPGGEANRSGWGGPSMGMRGHHGPMDPARVDERIDKTAERMMRWLDGTPEQRAKVAQIAKEAAKDLMPLREQTRLARSQATDLLKAETIDRAAIEKMRVEKMALAESASKRAAQAMADIAEVLTPEQRSKAAQWLASRAGRGAS